MATAPPFVAFIAPARRYPQIWRLLLGIVVCVIVFVAWLALIFAVLSFSDGMEEAAQRMQGLTDPVTPGRTLLLLTTFVGMALAPIVAARLLHRRGAASLFGPRRKVVVHFCVAVICLAVIYGGSLLLWSQNFDAEPNLPPRLWFAFLPFALLGVLVQTAAEELLFRGYLMQQLAARFRSALIYMLVPSLAFGILHYDPVTMGSNAWAVVGSTAFFGLIAADLTVATGSIGAAWGLHFANNVLAILVISTKGTITGLAIYLTPYDASDVEITGPLLMTDMILIILLWVVLRTLLRR
ncbi:hypothetical protein LX81_02483 [Palleronia aestuarii]|uniref:CAAX prenyl protease 2/Lysostaphin resistance protein A-like domain-containing protein n=1 Tax=Palleronia aestuarii TaxID=568105 RepID=A0A2W7N703_9RHOB|nr:CPBP family intramembrane glutamic endopeptidase [Palleronia aestuarii]PZX15850.1 hypothetical protein LX81_02483 [Palleronia aestuarii]